MSILKTYQQTFDAPNDNKQFLLQMCKRGLEIKGVADDEWYQQQLQHECEVIFDLGLEDFFLNTAYILAYLDDKGIYRSVGRGSACGSVVCYALNITKVPVKGMGLSFSRFLNKTRMLNALPDIDTDFASSQRGDALKYIRHIYGEDHTGQMITKLNYTPKMLIKDLSSRQGIDFQEVNQVTRQLDNDENYKDNQRVMNFLNKYPKVRDYIDPLTGLTKSLGKHAGGMIILDDVLDTYCSTVSVKGVDVISNTGKECESLNMLKNDCLAVDVLDVQRDCLALIKDNVHLPYNFDDPKVYETININPLGLFQLEGATGRLGIDMVHPDNFNELMDVIALIRPGARNSGYLDLYCDYKFGRKTVSYLDGRLKDILGETFGLMIYQENIMQVANQLAGMSDLDTDNLRRAVSKKNKDAFEIYKPKFINGCMQNDVEEDVAEKLWSDIENASEYSFNKAHCYSYSAVAYQSAWLKTYYPLEFAVAMLQNTKSDEKIIDVLYMIKESNADLLSPDINRSEANTTINGNEIIIGFNLIDKVSDKVSKYIINERNKNGDFKSFDDFCARVGARQCNKRVKENLINAGAFDNLPILHKEKEHQSRLI